MPLIKVFASFDLERDENLLNRLVEEGKKSGSNFVVCDRSIKDAASPETLNVLCERISKVDAVVVLCGVWTHRAPNVNAELKLAQELGKRYYLVKGHRWRDCARPAAAHVDDKLYKWTRGAIPDLVRRFR